MAFESLLVILFALLCTLSVWFAAGIYQVISQLRFAVKHISRCYCSL